METINKSGIENNMTYDHSRWNKDNYTRDNSRSGEGYSTAKILVTIILNLVIGFAEVIGGIVSGSLSLVSDALHNFSDALAIVIAYIAIRLSRITESESFTFGFKRGEIIAAFINSSALMVISLFLIWEAYSRFVNPVHIRPSIMFIVAVIGLVANFLGAFLLKKDSKKSINLKSAYLHLVSDAVTSAAVVAGAVAIYYFGICWIDPLLTVLISLYIMKESYHIFKESVVILMMGKPHSISLTKIKEDIEQFAEVNNMHHAHVWMLTDKLIHFEAHLDVGEIDICEVDGLIARIEDVLKEKHGIMHATLQIESSKCRNKNLVKEEVCHGLQSK